MPTGTLSGKGKALFEKVYNESLKGDCDKECAARKAWAAVKNAGWHKNKDGKWVKESTVLAEMSMAIVKASREKSDGTMRLRMVNSDTGEDVFGERMSLELFQDFVSRNDNNTPVPAPFDSVVSKAEHGYWTGGPPYLSIAHFRSGGGKNVPGHQERLYIDGEKLKSVDVLDDSPLGNKVWKAVYNDLYAEEKSYEHPVRVSIGFLDLVHKHEGANDDGTDYVFTRTGLKDKCPLCEDGVGNKVYLSGHLVHKAFTRVPAHPRTNIEVDEMTEKSGIVTKKEDARSIIEELADELEEKSVYDDLMVTKGETDYRQRANAIESAFQEQFAPPRQPSLYVSRVTDKNVDCTEYDPTEDGPDSMKHYRVGYKEDDNGNFSFDKRSEWTQMMYGMMPKKSKAGDSEWEVELMDEHEISKRIITAKADEEPLPAAEPESEAIMDEKEVLEQKPEAVEPVEKETVDAAPAVEQTELEKSAYAVVNKVKELAKDGHYGDSALKEVQPVLNQFAVTIKSNLAAPGGTIDEDALAEKVAAKLMPAFTEMVAKAMAGISAPARPAPTNDFVSRSINLTPQNPVAVPEEGQQKLTQIQRIARATT